MPKPEIPTTCQYRNLPIVEISASEVRAFNLMTGGNFTNDPEEFERRIIQFLKLADDVKKVRDARI